MSFTESDKTRILRLKSSISSYYNLQMKKIGDRQLEAFFFENCVISGGCISSLFHETAVADIDLYCKSAKTLTQIKDYIIINDKNIKSVDSYDAILDEPKEQFKLITQNAVTLTNDVQYIYMDTWDNCKKKFDFVHCMPYYDLNTQKLFISEKQYDSIKNKILISTKQVEVKPKRVEKYHKRGWTSDVGVGFIAQEIHTAVPYVTIETYHAKFN